MNRIYKVVWNHSLMIWTVVSELGSGRKKLSFRKKTARSAGQIASAMLLVATNAHALDINGYTDINSSTDIKDGMQWTGTAVVQVNSGADVTVANSGNTTLNMSTSTPADTSLWINGGSLTATNSGDLITGNNSLLQIGGAQAGGLTNQQQGGSAGTLSVRALKTSDNSTAFKLWMFGSSDSTAKLIADSIDLRANNNNLWFISPGGSELGSDINVVNDMTVVNGSSGTININGNSSLTVGGNLYLDTTGGSLLLTGNEKSSGITVGGDMTLTNNVKLSDINAVSTLAGIYSTLVNVAGNINVIGQNVGNTGLQLINATGTGVTTQGGVNISSTASGNTTDVIFGHSTKVKASKDINLTSVSDGAVNLYIGDSKYGAPTDISADSITMSGDGDNKVIFNNTKTPTVGTVGYLFDVPINGSGSVEQQSGHTTLSSASGYDGGTVISGGLLSITNHDALGTGSVAINTGLNSNSLGLDLAYTDGSDFTNTLTGRGTTTVSGDATIVGDNNNSGYTGTWNILGIATSDNDVTTSHTNFGSGDINIASAGKLNVDTDSSFDFENLLTGDGELVASNNGGEFNFGHDVGSHFSGTVLLKNNTFNLSDDNTTALTSAILVVGGGNTTTVGNGQQNIGGLGFDGGKLVFGNVSPGTKTVDNTILVDNELNLTGAGNIQITKGDDFENIDHSADTSLPLLQQDDEGILVQLVASNGMVTGNGGNLTLLDENGDVISDASYNNITQNGETVAKGKYDYRLTNGDDQDGLYVNYGLKEVELLTTGSNALTLNAEGNTSNAADLSAKVTGSGDLRIDTDSDVSLSNSENTYTGATWVTSGGLKLGNNDVLGMTRLLNLADDSHLDLNGYSQTLQNINTESGSEIKFNSGNLTINNGVIAGTMSGDGNLNVTGGQLTVSGDNTSMTADTTIASDGTVRMLSSQGLGTGTVNNQGLLYLGQDESDSTSSDTVITDYSVGNLINSGTVVLGHKDLSGNAVAGATLIVNGNYDGQDGHLLFNTVLGKDDSLTDKLVVTGDTTGTTGVSVTNAGGVGDKTLNGIELISVGGDSSGEFTQEGRIVAGAYDYSLVRGKEANSNNWYLVNNGDEGFPGNAPKVLPKLLPEVRPEGGSYIENLIAANSLFNTRLHDRLGETQYIDALTGEKKVTSLWLRQVGNHSNWKDGTGQLKTQSNSYVAQLGGDIAQWTSDGLDRGHLGLMAGYGNNNSSTHSKTTNYDSKGSIRGYSVGTYGTWFANEKDKSGLYIDSWLQYSWFNNNVKGESLTNENYKSKGFTASLESGYTMKMGEFYGSKGNFNEWFIQPQAQATWMGVKAHNHTESNGTVVSSDGNGNIQTRLGVRTYLKSHQKGDKDNIQEFEPFIEFNWLHNTRNFGTTMDGASINQAGARNTGEVKMGVEGKINPNLNVWVNIGNQLGEKGYRNTSAMIGVKYSY